MAVNDASTLNHLLDSANQLGGARNVEAREGIIQYVGRLMPAHFREALGIFSDIIHDPEMAIYLRRLSNDSVKNMALLRRLLPARCQPGDETKRSQHGRYCKYVYQLRNKSAFHYDRVMTTRALSSLASGQVGGRSSIVESDSRQPRDYRFAFADTVQSVLVCQYLWGAPTANNKQLERALDRYLRFIGHKMKALNDFSRELTHVFTNDCHRTI